MERSTGFRVSEAGASATARYHALWSEYRQQRLVARLVVAAAVGATALALFGWLAGLIAVAASVVIHTIYLLTKPSPVTRWRQGAAAERRTGRYLAALDPAAYHVLHDRALPGTPRTNLDHLVVGLTGVYAIATRRWALGVRIWADHRRLWVGNRPVTKILEATTKAARTISERLGAELDYEVPVAPVIAVHHARLSRAGVYFEGIEIQRARQSPRFIGGHPVIFTTAQAATIAAAAERMLPPMLD